ncbi:MAG: prepilin-type N-terminal cleavage/methylation domain-containing protein, partial [Alphaproteobacteria bacterium]|nr:prepilin-type N-terminal cleavage/methylation domain-containing protein [Alphaproteobacteria bacterium]
MQQNRDKKALKQHIQSGRSMIEMIGVLAVIGVLSLGGLLAYSIAMTYYRANQTIHDVMLRGSNVPMMW